MNELTLAPPLHMALVVVIAVAAALLFRRAERSCPTPRGAGLCIAAVAGAIAVLPWLTLPLSPPTRALLIGTEGAVEAFTAGLLLATVVLASLRGLPLLAVAALVVLLEEVDYGMPLLGYPDPAVMQSWGMLPGRFNFHNGPGSGLWRLVPLGTLLWLSYPGSDALARRLRLPSLHARSYWALPVMALAGYGTLRWLGPRALDESMECAFVALFLSAWALCRRAVTPPVQP